MDKLINGDVVTDVINKKLLETLENEIVKGWNTGLSDIVKNVVALNRELITQRYNDALKNALLGENFTRAITEEFQRKIAKNMVAKLEGQVEEAVNVIRQDQTLRAKMIVAIENIINEHQSSITEQENT